MPRLPKDVGASLNLPVGRDAAPEPTGFPWVDRIHHVFVVRVGGERFEFAAETDLLYVSAAEWDERPEKHDASWTVVRTEPFVVAARTTPP